MVANASAQRLEMAASAGWACRQAGIWTAEQDYPHAAPGATAQPELSDAELNDWLSKRFTGKQGKDDARPSDPAAREPGTARRAASLDTRLPALVLNQLSFEVARSGDSPRTASWRAAVAQMEPNRMRTRQRSRSPSLDNWLARRSVVKGSANDPKSRRAASLPPPSELLAAAQERDREKGDGEKWEKMTSLPAFAKRENAERKPWCELLEDEQAKEEEDDLFQELQQEERRRLAQAERT